MTVSKEKMNPTKPTKPRPKPVHIKGAGKKRVTGTNSKAMKHISEISPRIKKLQEEKIKKIIDAAKKQEESESKMYKIVLAWALDASMLESLGKIPPDVANDLEKVIDALPNKMNKKTFTKALATSIEILYTKTYEEYQNEYQNHHITKQKIEEIIKNACSDTFLKRVLGLKMGSSGKHILQALQNIHPKAVEAIGWCGDALLGYIVPGGRFMVAAKNTMTLAVNKALEEMGKTIIGSPVKTREAINSLVEGKILPEDTPLLKPTCLGLANNYIYKIALSIALKVCFIRATEFLPKETTDLLENSMESLAQSTDKNSFLRVLESTFGELQKYKLPILDIDQKMDDAADQTKTSSTLLGMAVKKFGGQTVNDVIDSVKNNHPIIAKAISEFGTATVNTIGNGYVVAASYINDFGGAVFDAVDSGLEQNKKERAAEIERQKKEAEAEMQKKAEEAARAFTFDSSAIVRRNKEKDDSQMSDD